MNKRGHALIADERVRHINEEGWTDEHDDEHKGGQLLAAAVCYIDISTPGGDIPFGWPWGAQWWKPTPKDRVRELVKAGALIAAEIDRLQRAKS